ncbi:MAG: hypothetical protein GWM98_12840 [Nitrospinaceae bacterium]|nr:hypothetical protein [Nitrospinaceae bacterium]NIR55201.1 hypothetical protein [Nitrospinaceae bacterium]NIT82473.1 hypothetical protein [Nitrospinaceae bacterium]NIU44678.1 hypothetical protein [Nitrospinaceae bacterium]NIU96845.1 hypothetical protein [Nitrospinaceae bacterium]
MANPNRKILKSVILRRGDQVLLSVSTRKLVPGIEQGKLFPTDEISTDGNQWVPLGEHKQLYTWFEKFSIPPTVEAEVEDMDFDREFLVDPSSEEELSPPLLEKTLSELGKLLDDING